MLASSWREPRAARPTQVLSRHWKKPDAAAAKKGKRASRHQELTPVTTNTVKMARLSTSMIKPPLSRLRRSSVLILGIQTSLISVSIVNNLPEAQPVSWAVDGTSGRIFSFIVVVSFQNG